LIPSQRLAAFILCEGITTGSSPRDFPTGFITGSIATPLMSQRCWMRGRTPRKFFAGKKSSKADRQHRRKNPEARQRFAVPVPPCRKTKGRWGAGSRCRGRLAPLRCASARLRRKSSRLPPIKMHDESLSENPRVVEAPADADRMDISADTLPRKSRKYSRPDRGGWVGVLPCVREAAPPAPHLVSGFAALSRMALRGCSFSGNGCVSCWRSVARCRRGSATLPPLTRLLGAADRCAPAAAQLPPAKISSRKTRLRRRVRAVKKLASGREYF
jgi:hypothetical protein